MTTNERLVELVKQGTVYLLYYHLDQVQTAVFEPRLLSRQLPLATFYLVKGDTSLWVKVNEKPNLGDLKYLTIKNGLIKPTASEFEWR